MLSTFPRHLLASIALSALAAGCGTADKLANVGQQPALNAIQDPTTTPGYRPVQMPMPEPQQAHYNPNSLWQSGSRAFFKDQRASQVGDILTVVVTIFLPASSAASDLANVNSDSSFSGDGSVDRNETLQTTVAAVVTQVLPNGNMVIEGRQEVRVNFEVRELIVAGIVRPEDITSDNRIASEQIAEARIGYGGRGQITDVQQPRVGNQVLDILLPF